MRVLAIVKATPNSEAGEFPSMELMQAMGGFNQKLVEAGIIKDAGGLKPTSKAARVMLGHHANVVHGPFDGGSELASGFWLWEVASLDEAIAWAKQCPTSDKGPFQIELRPLYSMEDFQ